MKKIKILAIETSGNHCGCSIGENGNILACYSVDGHNLHDKLLAEFVRRITNDLELEVDDLDAIALSSGPGSFTGLRIGAALVKGLCFGGSPNLIAIPTLDAFAASSIKTAKMLGCMKIFAIIPSHKNLYYIQEFDTNGNPASEIQILEKDIISNMDFEKSILCGLGATQFTKEKAIVELTKLDSRKILNKAFQMYESQEFTDPEKFTPMYVQDFVPKTSQKKLNI